MPTERPASRRAMRATSGAERRPVAQRGSRPARAPRPAGERARARRDVAGDQVATAQLGPPERSREVRRPPADSERCGRPAGGRSRSTGRPRWAGDQHDEVVLRPRRGRAAGRRPRRAACPPPARRPRCRPAPPPAPQRPSARPSRSARSRRRSARRPSGTSAIVRATGARLGGAAGGISRSCSAERPVEGERELGASRSSCSKSSRSIAIRSLSRAAADRRRARRVGEQRELAERGAAAELAERRWPSGASDDLQPPGADHVQRVSPASPCAEQPLAGAPAARARRAPPGDVAQRARRAPAKSGTAARKSAAVSGARDVERDRRTGARISRIGGVQRRRGRLLAACGSAAVARPLRQRRACRVLVLSADPTDRQAAEPGGEGSAAANVQASVEGRPRLERRRRRR